MRAPLALSLGDPAGIGPDIAIAAWRLRQAAGVPPFLVYGDAGVLRDRAAMLGVDLPMVESGPAEAAAVFATALPVAHFTAATHAEAVIGAIDRAVAATLRSETCAVVTNPIAKAPLLRAGFPHPGHTEYLGELAGRAAGRRLRPVMMLWSPELAVVPVTVHVALARVPALLTEELIVETGRIVARELAARFGVARPRLALCGLNPHAGEDGEIGVEDRDVVAPAVARLAAEGIAADGPWPADTLFHAEARARYDVALAMYHDQALIPIKTIAFDSAVNVTLGLGFVRTSPDHGTAFALAGTGRARPDSLNAALRLADRMSARAAQTAA